MAPDIFIDGFGQIAFRDGLIRIELTSVAGPHSTPEVRQHLVMTVRAFLQAMQAQQSVLKEFEKSGLIRRAEPNAPPVPGAEAPMVADPATKPATPYPSPKSPNFSKT